MPVRIKAIRDSARGQACTIQIPGACNHNTETTVLAHYQEPGHGGMGTKPDDSSAVYACSTCHDQLDGRTPWDDDHGLKEWYWFRGMRRTWRQLLLNEVLTTGKSGAYRQGEADRAAVILKLLRPCLDRDASLQKLVKAIEELDG